MTPAWDEGMETKDLTDSEVLELAFREWAERHERRRLRIMELYGGPPAANEQSGCPDYREDEQHHGTLMPEHRSKP